MEHPLLKERSRIIARHEAALRKWGADKTRPELRREVLAVVGELEHNLSAAEAAGLSALELARTMRFLADAYADLARHQRIPQGEDRKWLVRALGTYHRACDLLVGIDAPRDFAVLAFNHANAIRRLDREDAELLLAAKARYKAALPYFDAFEPARSAEVQEALDSLRVLLKLVPPVRKVTARRDDVAEVKATLLGSEEGDRCSSPEIVRAVMAYDGAPHGGRMGLVNRVAEIVAALPSPTTER